MLRKNKACLLLVIAIPLVGLTLVCAGVIAMNQILPKLWSPIYNQTALQIEVTNGMLARLNSGAEGEQVALTDLTPFEWERVCFFGMGASNEYINQVIGFKWLDGTGYVEEDRQIVAFTQGERVAQHLVFRPEAFGANTTDMRLGICLAPSEAVLTIGGYDSLDGRIRVFDLPDS